MKKEWIIFVFFSILFTFACQNKTNKNIDSVAEKKDTASTVQKPVPDLLFITEWNGKYPKDVDLLNQQALSTRLKALLKDQYETFSENWNTETPIAMVDSVIHTSGCKANDCSSLSYDLYIDLPNNNINMYNIDKGSITLFAEKDTIRLPSKLRSELRVIISNAKFKPVTKE